MRHRDQEMDIVVQTSLAMQWVTEAGDQSDFWQTGTLGTTSSPAPCQTLLAIDQQGASLSAISSCNIGLLM